jgi:two-component system, NarL family, response regulator DesR
MDRSRHGDRGTRPDIAVLDLETPSTDGLRAAEEIGAELPTRTVIVTRHARPAVLRRAGAARRPHRTARASVAEIATEVHPARGTVRNYLSAAMFELGAPTRHAAAHHAWQQGWI